MNSKVYAWADIEKDFTHGLVLGNGASIAFDQRFKYDSLKDKAEERGLIEADVQRVFDHLCTNDFELVLRMLWHASEINKALGITEVRTTKAYESVRDALVEVIRAIHVPYGVVHDRLTTAANFMSRFSTVISLSYDVLVYWAIMAGNDDARNRFKDCFVSGSFQQDWRPFREPFGDNRKATLVFYPHGNLALGADLAGVEYKIQTGPLGGLLNAVFAQWRRGETTPVFVSEGTSEQKRRAIRRSPYLSTVYEEVLPNLGESIVIFGWYMSESDDHILYQMCRGEARQFAVAVNPKATDLGERQAMLHRKLEKRLGRDNFELMLFDRSSSGCWIAP